MKFTKLDIVKDTATMLSDDGVQGTVGIISTKKDNKKVVYKMSHRMDYVAEHEELIAKSLLKLCKFSIHFCPLLDARDIDVDPMYYCLENQFDMCTQTQISIRTLFFKYVKHAEELSDIVHDKNYHHKNNIFSIMLQVIVSIEMAQKMLRFTHYDLHTSNIMVKNCDEDLVFFYKTSEIDTGVMVPSMGMYPIIIDYGHSYSKELNGKPFYVPMVHDNFGFTSDRFNPDVDMRIFLISLSHSLRIKKLDNIVRNLYGKMRPNWKTGWVETFNVGIYKKIKSIIGKCKPKSMMLSKSNAHGLEVIQSLITLPLKKGKYNTNKILKGAFRDLDKELVKFDTHITESDGGGSNGEEIIETYAFHVLKLIVNKVRELGKLYEHQQKRAVDELKAHLMRTLRPFLNDDGGQVIQGLDCDVIMSSMYILSSAVEEAIYSHLEKTLHSSPSPPIPNTMEIFKIIDENFNVTSSYMFSDKTKILLMDSTTKKKMPIQLSPEDIKSLNHPYCDRNQYISSLCAQQQQH